MKFQPTEEYRYPWPVRIVLPSQDSAGVAQFEEFRGIFRLQTEKEAGERQKALREATDSDAYVEASKAQIRSVLVDWERDTVLDAKGMPTPFSAEVLDRYLASAPFRSGVIESYGRSLAARPVEGN